MLRSCRSSPSLSQQQAAGLCSRTVSICGSGATAPTVQKIASRASGTASRQPNCICLAAPPLSANLKNFRRLSPPRLPLFSPPSIDEEEQMEDEEDCAVYVDRDGQFVRVMCCDYGYRAGSGRMYSEDTGTIPISGLQMAVDNFVDELACLRRSFRNTELNMDPVAATRRQPGPLRLGLRWLRRGLVHGLAEADRALERVRLLPPLDEQGGALPGTVRQGLNTRTEGASRECKEIRQRLAQLQLSNEAVTQREKDREAGGMAVETPWAVRVVYAFLCWVIDVLFEDRPIQRFWFLETVARMPYFSYISCLHLYESLGWWRAAAELRKVHFAEEWNELHHLAICEALGGDQRWADRFVGYHAAIAYYWILVAFYIGSPRLAYGFSELIEFHAVDTYSEFLDANEELLKALPPPLVAAQYFRSSDLYMFDEFQTSSSTAPRTPKCGNLYDVFANIRDDEGEHVKTMKACQDSSLVAQLAARKELPRRL